MHLKLILACAKAFRYDHPTAYLYELYKTEIDTLDLPTAEHDAAVKALEDVLDINHSQKAE